MLYMAVLTIKSGGRGRPLSIDPDKLLAEMYRKLPAAKTRLSQLRRETSGEQRELLLGSETALPSSVDAALDVLEALKEGAQISKQTVLSVKRAAKMVAQLASKQKRVYGRALSASLQEAYEMDIDYLINRGVTSNVTNKYLGKLKNIVNTMTPQQRQSFLLSKGYQSPKTATAEYRRVIEWAKNDYMEKSGVRHEFTKAEAWAYLLYRRAQDAL